MKLKLMKLKNLVMTRLNYLLEVDEVSVETVEGLGIEEIVDVNTVNKFEEIGL